MDVRLLTLWLSSTNSRSDTLFGILVCLASLFVNFRITLKRTPDSWENDLVLFNKQLSAVL